MVGWLLTTDRHTHCASPVRTQTLIPAALRPTMASGTPSWLFQCGVFFVFLCVCVCGGGGGKMGVHPRRRQQSHSGSHLQLVLHGGGSHQHQTALHPLSARSHLQMGIAGSYPIG